MRMIELNDEQVQILQSQKKIRYFVSGLGGGKTFCLGAFVSLKGLFTNPKFRGALILIGAPTYDQLNRSTMPGFYGALEKFNILHDIDYIVNKMPPKDWGIKPYSYSDNKNIITAKNGAYAIFDYVSCGGKKWRGIEADVILLDEVRDIDVGSINTLIGRLRGKCFKTLFDKDKYAMVCVTTPPDDIRPLLQMKERAINDGDVEFVQGSSYSNIANLPAGYIDSLISMYGGIDSPLTRREVFGEMVNINTQAFFYAFVPSINVVNDIKTYNDVPIYVSHDYNINKLCGVVTQVVGFEDGAGGVSYELNILDNPVTTIIDVQRHKSQNVISTAAARVLERWRNYEIYYCGDRSGSSGAVAAARYDMNSVEQFKTALNISSKNMLFNKYNLRYPPANPSHKYSYLLCNLAFNKIKINISAHCKDLLSDLNCAFIDVSKTGILQLHKDSGDFSMGSADAFRYLIHALFGTGSKLNLLKDYIEDKNTN